VDCLEGLEQEANAKHLQCCTCEWYAEPALRACCDNPAHEGSATFKCNSCCDLAVWRCGPNRYCDRCHREAYLEKDYPCPGPGLCPLGMPHPPNVPAPLGSYVEPFVVGCSACLDVALGCRDASDVAAVSYANGEDYYYEPVDEDWFYYLADPEDGGCSEDLDSEDGYDSGSVNNEHTQRDARIAADAWEEVKHRREATRASSTCRAQVRSAHLSAKRARLARISKGRAAERGRRFRGGRHKVSAVPWLGDDCSTGIPSLSDDDSTDVE